MSPETRARAIINSYSRGRQFLHAPTATELLVLAYDEIGERLQAAEERARLAEEKVASTVHARATDITAYIDVKLTAPQDPTVWMLDVKPVTAHIRMLSSHPSKWDPQIVDAVSREVRDQVHRQVWVAFETVRQGKPAKIGG